MKAEITRQEDKRLTINILVIVSWIFSGLLLLLAIVTLIMKKPSTFIILGDTVRYETIRDVKKYNHHSALLVFSYSIIYFLIGLVGGYSSMIGGILLIFFAIVGTILFVKLFQTLIYKKYYIKNVNEWKKSMEE